jgi:hypothetical protein
MVSRPQPASTDFGAVHSSGVKLQKLGEWMLAFPQKEVRRVLETDETGRPRSIQIVKAPRCAKRHLPGMVEAADRLATQALKEARRSELCAGSGCLGRTGPLRE